MPEFKEYAAQIIKNAQAMEKYFSMHQLDNLVSKGTAYICYY